MSSRDEQKRWLEDTEWVTWDPAPHSAPDAMVVCYDGEESVGGLHYGYRSPLGTDEMLERAGGVTPRADLMAEDLAYLSELTARLDESSRRIDGELRVAFAVLVGLVRGVGVEDEIAVNRALAPGSAGGR